MDTKIHIGTSVNKKKTPKLRCTKFEARIDYDTGYYDVLFLELTIYQNHKKLISVQLRKETQKITLTLIFQTLEKIANENNIDKMEYPDNDVLLKKSGMVDFVQAGNSLLNSLHIYVTKSPKHVCDVKEQQQIIATHHVDTTSDQHCGQKKLYAKIRDNFYWRYMTRDIAKFVRNCSVCMQAK